MPHVKRSGFVVAMCFTATWAFSVHAGADMLRDKADAYLEFFLAHHAPGLGGVVNEVEFADELRADAVCLRGIGDATSWSGIAAGVVAMRHLLEPTDETLADLLFFTGYLHDAKAVTQTPGYIARYVAPDELPFNCETPSGGEWDVPGEGEYAGYFWIGNTSRDQYVGWFWGNTWAAEALAGEDDPTARAALETIRDDMRDVIATLVDQDWWIVDQDGRIDGNGAAFVEPFRRLSWLTQAAAVTGDAWIEAELESRRGRILAQLPIDVWAWPNTYAEYYGFHLLYLEFDAIFRLRPAGAELARVFDIWDDNVRRYSAWTHNPWFDAMYLAACDRLGRCREDRDAIAADLRTSLGVMRDAPNAKVRVEPPQLPLDPFSVWAHDLLAGSSLLEDLWDIDPQTAEPHFVENRCWTDFLWQRSPYHIDCGETDDNPLKTAPGLDYLLPYWMAATHGLLPEAFRSDDEPDLGDPVSDAGSPPFSDPDDEDEEPRRCGA
ncbi:MAG: hypothetical protein IT350_09615 [Deltaproteobacteria bacterium]|nr:hypothetical protein [Deltaproteobacteria bacterium]